MAARAILDVVVGRGPVAGARSGAVEVLAPEQELDGVVAGGDVRFDAARLLQLVGQELFCDLGGIDLLTRDLDRGIGDHVGDVEVVGRGFVAVVGGDVVDEAFIERPGVDAPLPVVDDLVAEAESLGLHVGHACRDPGLAGRLEIGVGRRLDERIDGGLQTACAGKRVRVARLRNVGVGLDHLRNGGGRVGACSPSEHGGGRQGSGEQSAHGKCPLEIPTMAAVVEARSFARLRPRPPRAALSAPLQRSMSR